MKTFIKRAVSAIVIGVMSASLLVGCGNNGAGGSGNGSSVAKEGAAVTMDQGSISMGEARLYSYVMRSTYESYYGADIWDMEVEEGKTFGDSLKEMITPQLIQLIILSSQAEDYGVSLSEEDNTAVEDYVTNFKTNVGEEVMAQEGITEDDIRSVIQKSTLSGKVYEAMCEKENVELTDEEKADATCIKVQHVLISTSDTTKTDEEGNTVDMTDEEKTAYKEEQKALAEEVLQKAQNGEDFQALADEYSAENAGFEFSFDKDGYDPVNQTTLVEPFYKASWELGEGEISGLVESDYGYHIIKCVSLNDEEATQAAITKAQETKKTTSVDEKLMTLMDEAKYTESDEWQAYKITSEEASDETASEETASATETSSESTGDTEASSESAAETETASETAAE